MDAFFELIKSMPTPFDFITIVGMFAIFCGAFFMCYSAFLNYTLKRDMLKRGMSAEEIERVVNAGAKGPG